MLAMSRRGLLAALPVLTLAPHALAAPAAAREATARAVVATINGDLDRKAFLAAHVSPAGQARAARWSGMLDQVKAASGGVDYVGVFEGGERELLVRVRTRRQGVVRDLVARPDRDGPERLFDVLAMPRPTPYAGEVPERPLSRPALRAALARRLEDAAARDDFSGAVRVVAPDGEVVYEAVFGLANRDDGARITPDSRFHLGSADKSFTALIVGGLIGEGKLALDTRLVDVLPDYPNPDAARKITIGQLLNHSAGLGALFDRPRWNGRQPYSRVTELLPAFAAEPLLYEPGSRAAYSNEGFVVLGAVIEAVTGTDWYEQLAKRIYQPAGMSRSGHFALDEVVPGRVVGYRFAPEDVLGLAPRQPNWIFLGYRGNSCGGGYSTVADMTAYLRALRAGAILPAAMVEALTAQNSGGLPNYGHGFSHRKVGARTLRGHGGGGPGSGIEGDSQIVWETGWAYSILGNYDAPFASVISRDIGRILAAQD